MQKLNHLYMTTPALSAKDYENAGFHWLDCHQEERCIYAFERTDGKERIAAVFNFSDEDQEGYELPITDAKELEVILASDDVTFGGSNEVYEEESEGYGWESCAGSFGLFGGVLFDAV